MVNDEIPVFYGRELEYGERRTELQNCLVENGVFYLASELIAEADHEASREVALAFFRTASPVERALITNSHPRLRRGYTKLESESTALVTGNGTYSDYSMAYSCGLNDNVFPDARFEQIWTDYFAKLMREAVRTSRAVLLAAGGVDSDLELLQDCDPVLRLRYYPDVPANRCAEREPLRMAPHYDLSIITLIHQTACPNGFVSLQCEVGGRFVNIPARPGAMVVICGAVARIASDGLIQAPRHRVLAPPAASRLGSSRTSSVFFLRPSPNFAFSVRLARSYGFDIDLSGDVSTFGQWIGGNYLNLQMDDAATDGTTTRTTSTRLPET